MGHEEVEAFLTHLAVQHQVAVSTHRQALSALLFPENTAGKQSLTTGRSWPW